MESNFKVLQNRIVPETVTGGTERKTKVEGKSGPNAYVGSKSS